MRVTLPSQMGDPLGGSMELFAFCFKWFTNFCKEVQEMLVCPKQLGQEGVPSSHDNFSPYKCIAWGLRCCSWSSYLCRVVKQLIFPFSRWSIFHNFLKFFICAFLRDEESLIYVFRDNVLFSFFPVRTKKYLSLSAFLDASGNIMSEKHVVI